MIHVIFLAQGTGVYKPIILSYFTDTTITINVDVTRNYSICLPLPNSTALCSFTDRTPLDLAIGPACFIPIVYLSDAIKVENFNCYKNLEKKFNVKGMNPKWPVFQIGMMK